jgi:hypothetical protein
MSDCAAVESSVMTSAQQNPRPRPQPRRFEGLLAIPWAFFTLNFSINVIAPKLFLMCIYGPGRALREHLRIVDMPKGAAWTVSNGDAISRGHVVHFLFALVSWMALFAITYPVVRRVLPARRGTA